MVEKGKNRFILLEKITSLSTDAKTKEKHLYEILRWLGDWVPKYTFWQGWQEKNPQTSTAPCQPPSPQQMFQDKHTTCTRVSEVKSMLQELLDSAMFSTGELRAIRYIFSVVENLSKALILQHDENKSLETKYRRLKTEMVKELSNQRLNFQKSLQTLETKRDALLKQVDALGKKCHELFLIKHTLEYKLKKAEVAIRDSTLILDDSPDSPEKKTLPEEEAVMEETKQEHEEEQLLLPLVQRPIDMDMGWDSDLRPSSDQSFPSMTINPEIVDVISSKDTKILEPEWLSSAESPDYKDPNQKDFLQENEGLQKKEELQEKEDLQNQLHVSKQHSPESVKKEVDQSTQVEHWEKKLSSRRHKQQWLQERPQQRQREWVPPEQEHQERPQQQQREWVPLEREHQERPQQWQREWVPLEREHQERPQQQEREWVPLEREHQERPQQQQREWVPLEREHQERPQQQQREWVPLEREHQERLQQQKLEEVPKENVVQGEKEQESLRREPKRDMKRKPTIVISQGTFSKAEAPPTAPLSQAQSVQQCRRPHQSITPRNQRTVSSTEFHQKSGAYQVSTKPRKSATSPTSGLFLYKRTRSPLRITSIPLKEKVYHMDANAQRENLRLFLGNGDLGPPTTVRSKALKLTTTAMELSLLRLQCLCLKYIHYRHLQSLRQKMINHIQDMQNTRAPYQAHNLSIFLANINSLQNLKMRAWTDRQRTVEQKYQECLSNMVAVFPKLRLECNIPLQTPRISTPKLRKTKSSPSLLRCTHSSSTSSKQLFTSNSLDSASLQKAR